MLVFNFHHVEQECRHPSRKHISITPHGLRFFIRTLRFLGFTIVSLREVFTHEAGLIENPRNVLLTFDDGYVNNYTEALPVLEAERCPATIFVLPGRLSGTNAWDQSHLPESERDQLLSHGQMEQLAQSPYITLGSHGMSHQHFPEISPETLQFELEASYQQLSQSFPQAFLPVLAYPWGETSPQVLTQMQTSSYSYAFTVVTAPWQANTPRFEIPRYSVYYRDGNPVVLLAKLIRHSLIAFPFWKRTAALAHCLMSWQIFDTFDLSVLSQF